jgi:hypothetical protein
MPKKKGTEDENMFSSNNVVYIVYVKQVACTIKLVMVVIYNCNGCRLYYKLVINQASSRVTLALGLAP